MNGFASASRSRIVRILSSIACMALLACLLPLHAAASGQRAFTKSTVPAGRSAAVHHTLDGTGWAQMQEVTQADPAFDPEFGAAVAVHGTTAMIGARQAKINGNEAQGAVYVYHQDPDGTWIQTQKIVADDGQADDTFGNAIVFSGDTAFIGAYAATINGNFSQGAVYVFTLVDGTWTQTQKITASDGQMFDNFGYSLALERHDGHHRRRRRDKLATTAFQGAAYVYDGSSGTWTNTQKLSASDGGIGDIFGFSIAFDGTHAMIGAYANNGYQGAVYVFGQSNGTWAQTQKLVAADGASNTYFGYATALSGSKLLVGSWGANPGGNDTQGSAYIFTESNGTWSQTQELIASDGTPFDNFGHSVALQGTTALIGADGWSNGDHARRRLCVRRICWLVRRDRNNSWQATALRRSSLVFPSRSMATRHWSVRGCGRRRITPRCRARRISSGSTRPHRQPMRSAARSAASPVPASCFSRPAATISPVDADGAFTFATPLNRGAHYTVTVLAQPSNPAQTCTVANGDGTVGAANVDNVTVTCTTNIIDHIFSGRIRRNGKLAQTSRHHARGTELGGLPVTLPAPRPTTSTGAAITSANTP